MNSSLRSGFNIPTTSNNTDQFLLSLKEDSSGGQSCRKEPVILKSINSGRKHVDLGSDLNSTLS